MLTLLPRPLVVAAIAASSVAATQIQARQEPMLEAGAPAIPDVTRAAALRRALDQNLDHVPGEVLRGLGIVR